ncbi:MAG: hypothetical protein K2W96_00330, partial [Gemmataceae bacterium]|nr:hypothetical protein [Gemmataceae bacterium]
MPDPLSAERLRIADALFSSLDPAASRAASPEEAAPQPGSGTGDASSSDPLPADPPRSDAQPPTVPESADPATLSGMADGGIAAPNQADGTVKATATADSSGNWTAGATLDPGTTVLYASKQAAWGAANLPSPAFFATVDTTAPTVSIDADTSITRLRPEVRVRASDRNGLPDGTPVTLAVGGTTLNGFLRDGQAVFTLPTQVVGTSASVTTTVTDLAGNAGTASASIAITAQADPWAISARALSWDPERGDALSQVGDLQQSVALMLGRNPDGLGYGSSLVYNSEWANARPVVQATLKAANSGAMPTAVRAQPTWDGVAQQQQTFAASAVQAGRDLTVALRPDSATSTGRHAWSIAVTLDFAGQASVVKTVSGTTYAVDNSTNEWGTGWTLSLQDRLHSVSASGSEPAGLLRAFGTG